MRNSTVLALMILFYVTIIVGGILVRHYYGLVLASSPIYLMFMIALCFAFTLYYTVEGIVQKQRLVDKTLSFGMAFLFFIIWMGMLQQYEIKVLMGL
jgi:uncharacterized membrane protein YhaH (DUF805 family)